MVVEKEKEAESRQAVVQQTNVDTGDYKTVAHEQAVHDATEPGSPNWSLAYWMPKDTRIETFADWDNLYGAAKARINQCCASPGVSTDDCNWVPIPSDPR